MTGHIASLTTEHKEQVQKPDLGQQIESLIPRFFPQQLRFLYKYPIIAPIIYLIVANATQIGFSVLFGGFSGTPNVKDLTEDSVGYLFEQAVLAAEVFYFFLIPTLLQQTFSSLCENRVFVETQATLSEPVRQRLTARWLSWLPFVLSLSAIIFVTAVIYFDPENLTYWYEVHPISLINKLVMWFVPWSAMAEILLNVGLAIYLIRAVFQENPIVVHRLHPDKCGGFAPLSRFSLSLTYLALLYGLLLIIAVIEGVLSGTITTIYGIHLQVIAYIIIVPTVFYLPLHNPHKAMLAFRDRLISKTSDSYLHTHLSIYSDKTSNPKEFEDKVKSMNVLADLEKHELAYPVWPVTYRNRLRVLANAISPLAATIVGIIIERII